MPGIPTRAVARLRNGRAQGWFMRLLELLARRTARPPFLYPGELSPHLLRDIGLADVDRACRRRWS